MPRALQPLQALPDLVARLGVEARRGLVENQEVGLVDQGPREHDPAHEPPRKLRDGRVPAVFQGDEFQQLQGPGGGLRTGDVEIGREDLQILQDGEFGIEVVVLLTDADAVLHLAQLPPAGDILSEHVQRASRKGGETVDHPDRRRLAGAVGPENAEALPAPDGKGDPVDGGEGAEGFSEGICLDDGFHHG